MNDIIALKDTVKYIEENYNYIHLGTLYLNYEQWSINYDLLKTIFNYKIIYDGCDENYIQFYDRCGFVKCVSVEVLTDNDRIIKEIIE